MELNLGSNKSDNFLVSKKYENSLDIITKQTKGIYYTPKIVVEYIMEKTLKKHDIVKNPCPKVLDISCGCGNFLLEAYDIIYDLIANNIYELKEKYGEVYWKTDNIHNHIISNCIYGADIDKDAIEILIKSLQKKDKNAVIEKLNLYCCDSLKKEWEEKFDYIVGNPPYVGHKKLDNNYKEFLMKEYNQVYKDKSDLYYCFYKKIIELLNENGISSIITPRYFLESPSGKSLRNYIKHNICIEEIVDFLGCSIFKNIGICSCIVTLNKALKTNNNIEIFKIVNEGINLGNIDNIKNLVKSDKFEHFSVNQDTLGDEWIIVNKNDELFYNKIQAKGKYKLEDIAISFQGIITGCDKAFILNKEDEIIKNINNNLLKPWVKNKNISQYIVKDSEYSLIYSNDIDDESKYHTEINEFIGRYKNKLSQRRECKKNIRKWYELQWGREKYLFEQVKIMYPYKCGENRFAIDYDNNFCSADVYSFYIKEEYTKEFSYEYLVGILNSKVYDKYFKMTAKKISRKLYDYYPNKVMKMNIFKDYNYEKIEDLSKTIIERLKYSEDDDVQNLKKKIDELIEQSLDVQSLI